MNRSDDFTRANSALSLGSPSDGGSAWVAASGTWGIFSNQAYKVASGGVTHVAYLEASSSVGDVSVVINTVTGKFPGVGLRIVDATNFIFAQIEVTFLKLYKDVAGSFTQLGSTFTGTISAGDIIMLSVTAANSLTVKQNGVTRVGPVTDATHSTATKVGIMSAETGTNNTLDNFLFTDNAAAAFNAAWNGAANTVIGSGARHA